MSAQPSFHHNSQALSIEFVDDPQDLDGTTVVRAVCHEIIGPEMVATGGLEPHIRPILEAQTSSVGLLLWNLQPL
jgi:hypothetical protein